MHHENDIRFIILAYNIKDVYTHICLHMDSYNWKKYNDFCKYHCK
jgi:hypothetical protein